MLTQQQLDNIKTSQECQKEIEKRYAQLNQCVGWLYSSILRDEIYQLNVRYNELLYKERAKP